MESVRRSMRRLRRLIRDRATEQSMDDGLGELIAELRSGFFPFRLASQLR
jgi:hypothetical protein